MSQFKGCILRGPVTLNSHSCPDSETPGKVVVECSLDLPNLKAAPEGSLVAQPIPKCIAAHFFSAEEMVGELMMQLDLL